jgi:hypothetical protein
MFTWICPKCGREVPPAYDDCPDCAAQANAGTQPGEPATAPAAPVPASPEPASGGSGAPLAPAPAPPQHTPGPFAQSYAAAAPPQAAPRRVSGASLPVWLMAVVFGFSFVGLGACIYWAANYFKTGGKTPNVAAVESPAAHPGAKTNPLQKYIEVSGVRFFPDPKQKDKVRVKALLTNHSEADLAGLAGNVTVWGRTQKSEEDAEGNFAFTTNLRPLETKEIEVPFNTKLKIYELPDWQNATTDLQITAPQ